MYLGIDFGTSTNHIVRWNVKTDKIESVVNIGEYAKTLMQNTIYYSEKGVIIGHEASLKKSTDAKNLVEYIKIHIGEENFSQYIPALGKSLSASEISRDIFRELKNRIEEQDKSEKIEGVVITVPFGYLHAARKSIREAATAAGLNVISLIEEPLAAAIRVKDLCEDSIRATKNILIFDLGGGTLDITIFQSRYEGDINFLEVLNTEGNNAVGGKYIDDAIFDKIKNKENLELSLVERMRCIEKIKEAKELLSDDDDLEIMFKYSNGIVLQEFELDEVREILIESNILEKISYALEKAIIESGLEKKDIDEIIMVGGASKLGVIREFIEMEVGCEIKDVGEASKLVGEGAAIYVKNKILKNSNLRIIPTLNHSIGIDRNGVFIPILNKNSRYEVESKIEVFKIQNKESSRLDLNVYQGDNSKTVKCSKVGKIEFETDSFKDDIGVSFKVNDDGIIIYKLYKIDELLNKTMILESELN